MGESARGAGAARPQWDEAVMKLGLRLKWRGRVEEAVSAHQSALAEQRLEQVDEAGEARRRRVSLVNHLGIGVPLDAHELQIQIRLGVRVAELAHAVLGL